MFRDIFSDAFNEYLNLRGIFVVERIKKPEIISQDSVVNQLMIISEFHKKVMGYEGYINKRLDNRTGKLVERYKINLKRLKRDIKRIEDGGPQNTFEAMLIKKSQTFIQRGEYSIGKIYSNGYINILDRSMKRGEVCLENTNFNNITKNENIEILDIRDCCYNIVELDAVYLLRKIKKMALPNMDFYNLAEDFCNFEKINSVNFILAVLSYPYYFMKCYCRYREGRKDWDIKTYCEKLNEAIEHDNSILI